MRLAKLEIVGVSRICARPRMRLLVTAGVLFVAGVLMPYAALAGDEPGKPGDIILQFPSPGSSPGGLAWDGTHLWVADDAADTVYQLDSADGRVLASFKSPGAEPRGMVWDGRNLWHADNATRRIYKLDRGTGAVQSTMTEPDTPAQARRPELAGLTWDGRHLWCGTVNGWSSRMSQIDPNDGSTKQFFFTKGYPRALATDGTSIWSVTDNEGRRVGLVYKYKLSDGLFVSQFDTPGFYPTGLAWDGQHLWCVDRETKTIYKLVAN